MNAKIGMKPENKASIAATNTQEAKKDYAGTPTMPSPIVLRAINVCRAYQLFLPSELKQVLTTSSTPYTSAVPQLLNFRI
tara:strand:- start:336 stop:575 length:240 start_codon:yes stop_codon:yes gene_type:complete